MGKSAFVPGDILIPSGVSMEDWSVIACDQFTSERRYWDRVAERTRGKMSTFHMMLPEAYLGDAQPKDTAGAIRNVMESYLSAGIFETLGDSFVYVERNVTGGVRRGLVGVLDLEAYDYSISSAAPVRASEGTVMERLPARALIREAAPLEMPHAMVLISDPKRSVLEPLHRKTLSMRELYDFELMEDGGRIRGWQVEGKLAESVNEALSALAEKPLQIVVGDGNHSLAAAKEFWLKLKKTLSPEEAEHHPARYALAELCNVYDDAVLFEPIHRVVFNVDPDKLMDVVREKLVCAEGRTVTCVCGGKKETVHVRGKSFGGMIEAFQDSLEEYAVLSGGNIDYIHDEDALYRLTKDGDCVGFLMPAMDKAELFSTVEGNGVFPKKSFSIGRARDKRYYLECRRIK